MDTVKKWKTPSDQLQELGINKEDLATLEEEETAWAALDGRGEEEDQGEEDIVVGEEAVQEEEPLVQEEVVLKEEVQEEEVHKEEEKEEVPKEEVVEEEEEVETDPPEPTKEEGPQEEIVETISLEEEDIVPIHQLTKPSPTKKWIPIKKTQMKESGLGTKLYVYRVVIDGVAVRTKPSAIGTGYNNKDASKHMGKLVRYHKRDDLVVGFAFSNKFGKWLKVWDYEWAPITKKRSKGEGFFRAMKLIRTISIPKRFKHYWELEKCVEIEEKDARCRDSNAQRKGVLHIARKAGFIDALNDPDRVEDLIESEVAKELSFTHGKDPESGKVVVEGSVGVVERTGGGVEGKKEGISGETRREDLKGEEKKEEEKKGEEERGEEGRGEDNREGEGDQTNKDLVDLEEKKEESTNPLEEAPNRVQDRVEEEGDGTHQGHQDNQIDQTPEAIEEEGEVPTKAQVPKSKIIEDKEEDAFAEPVHNPDQDLPEENPLEEAPQEEGREQWRNNLALVEKRTLLCAKHKTFHICTRFSFCQWIVSGLRWSQSMYSGVTRVSFFV